MLFFSMFMVSVFSIASDMNQNVVFFDNLPKDAYGHVLPKCFICEKHGANSYLINRFAPSIHKKCYDPVLEIEPAYAVALVELLEKNKSTVQTTIYNQNASRKMLLRNAFKKVEERNCLSFEDYSNKFGKRALETVFFEGFVTLTQATPFAEVYNWDEYKYSYDKFIPEGNENILK